MGLVHVVVVARVVQVPVCRLEQGQILRAYASYCLLAYIA